MQISSADVEGSWYDDYVGQSVSSSYTIQSCLLYGDSSPGEFVRCSCFFKNMTQQTNTNPWNILAHVRDLKFSIYVFSKFMKSCFRGSLFKHATDYLFPLKRLSFLSDILSNSSVLFIQGKDGECNFQGHFCTEKQQLYFVLFTNTGSSRTRV